MTANNVASRDLNTGEFVHSYWKERTFNVRGNKLSGTGVLIQHKEILSAAHLGFKLGEKYELNNAERGQLSAQCVFINKQYDFAVLKCDQLPEEQVNHQILASGREYCILGFPQLVHNQDPSIINGMVENLYSDGVHFVGTPGARRGFSGGPVVTKGNGFYGILIGGIDELTSENTVQEIFKNISEQKSVRILPYATILTVRNLVPTDQES